MQGPCKLLTKLANFSDKDRVDPNLAADPVVYHPVFVFEKNSNGFWGSF